MTFAKAQFIFRSYIAVAVTGYGSYELYLIHPALGALCFVVFCITIYVIRKLYANHHLLPEALERLELALKQRREAAEQSPQVIFFPRENDESDR